MRIQGVARPEGFDPLLAFWFVVGKAGNPNALQVSHLQAAPPSKILPQLVHKLVHTRTRFMKKGAPTGDETLSGDYLANQALPGLAALLLIGVGVCEFPSVSWYGRR
jgi:hypothetical protein